MFVVFVQEAKWCVASREDVQSRWVESPGVFKMRTSLRASLTVPGSIATTAMEFPRLEPPGDCVGPGDSVNWSPVSSSPIFPAISS